MSCLISALKTRNLYSSTLYHGRHFRRASLPAKARTAQSASSRYRVFSTMPVTRSQTQQLESSRNDDYAENERETVAVVGTGWAGWTLAQELDGNKYNIVIVSKERTMALTPLLASATCSIFDFRNAEEPVRRRKKKIRKFQAVVTGVDFVRKTLHCQSEIEGVDSTKFEVGYDKLILAPGCETNTFGTPGVEEHAYFLKSVRDATRLRARILDIFEAASLPTMTEKQRMNILHIAIIGGGPTGVELAAEIDDLVSDHLFAVYPHLQGLVSLTLYDVAPKILSPFDKSLGEYAMKSFRKRNVRIETSVEIEKVEKGALVIKELGRVPVGMLIWATGNKQVPLVDELEVKKENDSSRILTDRQLRVMRPDGTVFEEVFALGDAADIEKHQLPTTAEVAVQKAKYLCKKLNSGTASNFEYDSKALVAYVGGGDGVISGKTDWTGGSAWLAWRSGNLQWTRSWRRTAMIWINWIMNYLDGRELARK